VVLYMYSLVIRLSWQQSLLHEYVAWRRCDVAGNSALLIHSLTVHMVVAFSIMLIEVVDGVQLNRQLPGGGISKRRNDAMSFIPVGVLAPFSFIAGAFASLSPAGAARVNVSLSWGWCINA
jgi:hypothetical protein